MSWMNRHEVATALYTFDPDVTPNLARGARILQRLVDWTDENSDGWPYWTKPSRAASKLADALHAELAAEWRGAAHAELSDAELRKLLAPIKAFLTRQGVPSAVVIDDPAPADPESPREVRAYLSDETGVVALSWADPLPHDASHRAYVGVADDSDLAVALREYAIWAAVNKEARG